MARTQLGTPGGFVDVRQNQRNNGVSTVATPANYATVASRDARLSAANPTLYSARRLQTMTENDKVFALRLIDDAAGIR